MTVSKLTHTVNITVGTTTTQKIAEFCSDFTEWLYANWPGTDTLTKYSVPDVVGQSSLLLNKPWNGTSSTAQAGGSANTIKLVSTASAVDSFYVGQQITITGGTSAGDVRTITGYVGSTKIATVDTNFTATPGATSTYTIKDVWVPQWLKDAWPDASSYRYIMGAILFTHAASQTDWCLVSCQDGSTAYGNVCIGIRQNNGGQIVYTEITRYSPTTTDTTYLNNAETLVLNILDKTGEYKIINKDVNASATLGSAYYNGIVRLDNPVNPADVNAWILFGMNDSTKQRFTRQYTAEALGTQISSVTDTLVPEAASFDKNVYSAKIPLARVWAGSSNLGMRGWTSWLAAAPQSYVVSNQNYTIGTDTYYGLGLFDGQIVLPGGGVAIGQRVMLKV